jgi:hypothetical protein
MPELVDERGEPLASADLAAPELSGEEKKEARERTSIALRWCMRPSGVMATKSCNARFPHWHGRGWPPACRWGFPLWRRLYFTATCPKPPGCPSLW